MLILHLPGIAIQHYDFFLEWKEAIKNNVTTGVNQDCLWEQMRGHFIIVEEYDLSL